MKRTMLMLIIAILLSGMLCGCVLGSPISQRFDKMTDREKAAQLLIVGFSTKQEIVDIIKTHKVGGVIFFKNNIDNRAHVKELIRQLQEVSLKVTGTPLMVCIDEEGGKVDRLVDSDAKPFSRPNIEWGDLYAQKPDKALEGVHNQALSTANSLKSMGFNVNFAPVLDVCDIDNNALFVKFGRSYGADPDVVAKLGVRYIKSLQGAGVAATAKHFPGHGSTVADTHLGFVEDPSSLEKIHSNHLVPFKAAIAAGVRCIMISHVTYKALDPERPATLSPAISAQLLRKELGYKGMIVSDSLTMGAINTNYGKEAYSMCVNSGIDTMIIDQPEKGAIEEAIAQVAGHVSAERLNEACSQVIKLKDKFTVKTK